MKQFYLFFLMLSLLFGASCTKKKEEIKSSFALVYTANLLGEIEPCG